ncbi:MAG TPA: RidA family protein [Bryobacterales bacterium]|nr:RidA family protein [Bryobacterales bacterium]
MKLNRAAAAVLLVAAAALWAAPKQKAAKQFLNPEVGSKPVGYTHVVTSPPGKMIFISGQGGAIAGKLPPDFSSQAKNTFENLGRCLKAAGATFNDVVKVNYYVTDMANTTELRRIRAQYLNQSAPPASTLVQVGLGHGSLVEIEMIAIVPE